MPTPTDLTLCRSDTGDGGWSLHAPGATDREIGEGNAPVLLDGTAELVDGDWNRPNAADYAEAFAVWTANQ